MGKQRKTVSQNRVSAVSEGIRHKWLNSPVIPAAVVILILLPFINKAFNIDDPLFVWAGQHIQKHPLDFYGFKINWYAKETPMFDITKNPPLASYYIAAIGTLFGFGEIPLHIGFILPAIAAAVGTFYLARHFCENTLVATLIAIVNPVFLVSATSVMCDTMMLAFWVWALYFWMRGIENQEHRFLLAAAIFTILCEMTKYFGISLIPLTAVYGILNKRRKGPWIFYWLLPIMTLVLYQWWTFTLYGKGLLSDAFSYSVRQNISDSQLFFDRVLISLAFTGGCLVTVFFYSHLIWSGKTLFAGIAAIIVFIGLLYFSPEFRDAASFITGEFSGSLIAAMGLMIIPGVSLIGLTLDELRKRRDRKTLFLFLWVIGTFVFAGFINWTINARSLLPLAPAAGILIACRLERNKIQGLLKWLMPLVPALLIAVATVWADYAQANSARTAAQKISSDSDFTPDKLKFEGHWGFQYYMEKAGCSAVNFEHLNLSVGDFLVLPSNNTNVVEPDSKFVSLKKTFAFTPCPWLTLMNQDCGAGFYSHRCGPVPYMFGKIPPEIYSVKEVKTLKWKVKIIDR